MHQYFKIQVHATAIMTGFSVQTLADWKDTEGYLYESGMQKH